MIIDRETRKQELINLTSERSATVVIFLLLFVVTVVFALMVSYSITFLIPFGFSVLMFCLIWYSLVKQCHNIERKRIELGK